MRDGPIDSTRPQSMRASRWRLAEGDGCVAARLWLQCIQADLSMFDPQPPWTTPPSLAITSAQKTHTHTHTYNVEKLHRDFIPPRIRKIIDSSRAISFLCIRAIYGKRTAGCERAGEKKSLCVCVCVCVCVFHFSIFLSAHGVCALWAANRTDVENATIARRFICGRTGRGLCGEIGLWCTQTQTHTHTKFSVGMVALWANHMHAVLAQWLGNLSARPKTNSSLQREQAQGRQGAWPSSWGQVATGNGTGNQESGCSSSNSSSSRAMKNPGVGNEERKPVARLTCSVSAIKAFTLSLALSRSLHRF